MITISRKTFEEMMARSIKALPKTSTQHLSNVAFIVEDDVSKSKREELGLLPQQTLFGLYEGVPLSARQGATKLLPDKITLYQKPLEFASRDIEDLYSHISKTIWHEVAHYFGLDHKRINELDQSHN